VINERGKREGEPRAQQGGAALELLEVGEFHVVPLLHATNPCKIAKKNDSKNEIYQPERTLGSGEAVAKSGHGFRFGPIILAFFLDGNLSTNQIIIK